MMLALDVYYQHYDVQPDIVDICQMLFIPDETSIVGRSIAALKNCTAYAMSKIAKTEVLTAGDILKIDAAINAADGEFKIPDMIHADCEKLIEQIWSSLYDLYSPNPQHPLLLEAAIACYRILTFPKVHPFNMQTLAVLLSTVFQNELASCGLARQWILSTDPRIHLSSIETSDALAHIQGIFRSMWAFSTTLIRSINQKKIEISHSISMVLPQYAPAGCIKILSESLCIKTRAISEKFGLSQKTATKYLRQLEQESFLHSVKYRREVLYFNSLMIDVLKKQLLEISAYGA